MLLGAPPGRPGQARRSLTSARVATILVSVMKVPELVWPAEPQDYDEGLLLDIQPGTVALLIRGRNAWNSTWVRHYLRNSTLYTDVASAKLGAERQRGPGNVFYIVEAPALLLSGQRRHVVLCDAHPDNPFGSFAGFAATVNESLHGAWIDGLFPGVSLRDAVTAFRHDSGHWSGPMPSEHSLRTGMLDTPDLFDTRAGPMLSLVSRPIGSNYYLQWDPSPAPRRYSRRGTNAVARRWTEDVKGPVRGRTRPDARARQLLRHREEVIRALPKSQWLRVKAEAAVEKRLAREKASDRWSSASDRVEELEGALWRAEGEQDAAAQARMTPASTSAGIRKQRERAEAAVREVERLTAELAEAHQETANLWALYLQS